VPNPDAQVALMHRVANDAGIDARSVQYVEAHGTGTPVGDPIEASAIATVYGNDRDKPCRIGSVKSNIGHLEAAAGVAGIIKACLMLQENQVPALATLERPNPNIPFGENGLELADRQTDLAPTGTTPRVAVNSFGYGGTNAHAILSLPDEVRQAHDIKGAERHNFCQLVPLSARDDQALKALAGACAQRLRDPSRKPAGHPLLPVPAPRPSVPPAGGLGGGSATAGRATGRLLPAGLCRTGGKIRTAGQWQPPPRVRVHRHGAPMVGHGPVPISG
jgi:acyl transferase domain-containing protein